MVIQQALHTDSVLENVVRLTLRGEMDSRDIMVIRNKMVRLRILDMTDVSVKTNNTYSYYTNCYSQENELGKYSFYNLNNLINVKLSKNLVSLGDYAFMNCQNLRSITNVPSVGRLAFTGCANLETVVFSDNLKTIGECAFSGNHYYYDDYNNQSSVYNTYIYFDGFDYGSNYGGTTVSFTSCYNLRSIEFPGTLKSIDRSAFAGLSLQTVSFLGAVDYIGDCAFCSNSGLVELSMRDGSYTDIGVAAFFGCSSLESIRLPRGLSNVQTGAFASCYGLREVSFPATLTYIGKDAFRNCSSLLEVQIPTYTKTLSENAFWGCSSLNEVRLPENLSYIGKDVFKDCYQIDSVFTYTIAPLQNFDIDAFSQYTYQNAILVVPPTSYWKYWYDTEWSRFLHYAEIDAKYEFESFYLTDDYVLNDSTGVINGMPDLTLYAGAGFIVETTDTQYLKTVTMHHNGLNTGSIIGHNNIVADSLAVVRAVDANTWYFISTPDTVRISEMTMPSADYAFRYYDAESRANNSIGGNWKDVTDDKLEPGKGYIFISATSGNLVMPYKNPKFRAKVENIDLNAWPSNNLIDASWNFIGNPSLNYYSIDSLGYNSPITVWDRRYNTYIAYNAANGDKYAISPFEGFFVQKPEAIDSIGFRPSARLTYNQYYTIYGVPNDPMMNDPMMNDPMYYATRATAGNVRQCVYLTLSNDEQKDFTRVVFNENASSDYDPSTDAAKFYSMARVAQLYSLDSEKNAYSLNELPLDTVPLGFIATRGGTYTIEAERLEANVVLYDALEDVTFDLASGAYSFEANEGTFDSRFFIILATENAIEKVESAPEAADVEYYDLSGAKMNANAALDSKVYLIKKGNKFQKVINNK